VRAAGSPALRLILEIIARERPSAFDNYYQIASRADDIIFKLLVL
jgi:hypothetical protein